MDDHTIWMSSHDKKLEIRAAGGCGKVGPTDRTKPGIWGTCGLRGLCDACKAKRAPKTEES